MKFDLPSEFIGDPLQVVVIGAGGTGSAVLANLAQLAVALPQLGHPGLNVTVFDDDTVSPSNIGRQLFAPGDVGRYKADVLVHRINAAFGLRWESRVERFVANEFESPRGLAGCLIGCVDTRRGRREIFAAHQARGRASMWLDCGNLATTGQVVLGVRTGWSPGKVHLPCAADLFPEIVDADADDTDETPTCSVAESLQRQDLFVNRMMADTAVNLLWQVLRNGGTDDHGAFINTRKLTSRPIPVSEAFWKTLGWERPADDEDE